MTTKKKGLGKGADALFENGSKNESETPVHEQQSDSTPTDIQRSSAVTSKVTALLCENLPGMTPATAEMTLNMIIGMCQSQMRFGVRG